MFFGVEINTLIRDPTSELATKRRNILTSLALPSGTYTLSASWNASANATGYTVQYCYPDPSHCFTTDTTATSLDDIDEIEGRQLVPNEITVQVQACNGDACSAYSTAVHPQAQLDD